MFRVASRTGFVVDWILILLLLNLFSCSRGPEEIAVSSVALTQTTAEMIIGETVQLQVSISPSNATDKNVLWASSNQSVATVDREGKVMAISAGYAMVTATVGGKSATCQVTVLKGFVEVSSLSLNTGKVTLTEGETTTLTATVHPEDATDKSVLWSSSASDVASVVNGVVTANKAGTAIITAKAGEKTAECLVEVKSNYVEVTSLTLNKNKLTLTEGDYETLTATVKPDNATDKSVTWTSSDASIASISIAGKVTAIKEGTAVITAQAGNKQAMCVVEVSKKEIPVNSIQLNKTSLKLEKGKYETLVATISPSNATNANVTWSSSNAQVASVDQNGLVMALAGGSAVITAKAGEKTATCTVTVTVPVESLTLSETALVLVEEQSATLTATVNPSDATVKTVTWSSNNMSVATVSNGMVKAIREGTAVITAKAENKTATCTVTVKKQYISVTSISLNKNTLSLTIGDSETLQVTVNPADATNKAVTWSSSNTSIATVDANGKVTAITPGTTQITVTTQDGGYKATCSVTVKDYPMATSLSLTVDSFEAVIGQTYSIAVTASPSDAVCEYEWTSSDTRVATINGTTSQANIQTKDYGTTTITVKERRSGLTKSITVSTVVTDFAWNMETTKTYNGYPLLVIHLNEKTQLNYTCTPASATHIFGDLSQFIFYENSQALGSPVNISVSDSGEVKGLKVGITGIEAKGRLRTNGTARIYIRVIDNGNTEPIDDDENEHGWD